MQWCVWLFQNSAGGCETDLTHGHAANAGVQDPRSRTCTHLAHKGELLSPANAVLLYLLSVKRKKKIEWMSGRVYHKHSYIDLVNIIRQPFRIIELNTDETNKPVNVTNLKGIQCVCTKKRQILYYQNRYCLVKLDCQLLVSREQWWCIQWIKTRLPQTNNTMNLQIKLRHEQEKFTGSHIVKVRPDRFCAIYRTQRLITFQNRPVLQSNGTFSRMFKPTDQNTDIGEFLDHRLKICFTFYVPFRHLFRHSISLT